jgi:adenylate kinase family enzyme
VETPDDEFAARIESLAAGDRWIIDGYHRVCLDQRLRAADTIVFFDLPRRTCLWRIVMRRLRHHGRTRPDMTPGCPEKIDPEFLRYVWTFNRAVRPNVMNAIHGYAQGRSIHVLRSTADAERFLAAALKN